MDIRHSNDEFSSKISNRGSQPQNSVANKTNNCFNSILLKILPKTAGTSLSNLSGQKEPKLFQTLFTSAFVVDKCTAIQNKFIRRGGFSYKLNIFEKIDNDDKKARQ